MSNWDNLLPDEMAAFRTTLRSWLDLRICSGHALAAACGLQCDDDLQYTAGQDVDKQTKSCKRLVRLSERILSSGGIGGVCYESH